MLMSIDVKFNHKPSQIINWLTCGPKGASMCARLYLYNRYVSRRNMLVNGLKYIIDKIEKDHCYTSARHWRLSHVSRDVNFPVCYYKFIRNKK